jgi:hypothetical protein
MSKTLLFIATIASAAILVSGPARAAQSQQSTSRVQALTNKEVLEMLAEGLSPEIIVAKIKSSACNFDTSPQALKDLKAASAPDSVILAMIEAGGASATPTLPSDGKPRVYVSDSQSWLVTGGFGESNGTGGGAVRGGSSPQTVEVIKTFQQRCPEIVVTNEKAKTAYAILFDRESFKGLLRNRDKIAVFRRNGDSIYSNSTKSVGNAVKDACQAILKDSRTKAEPSK